MRKIFIIIFIAVTSVSYSQTGNQFIFLFDNSGSMLPYYTNPGSNFKIFCKALIKNSVKGNDKTGIYLFTKTDPKRAINSPKMLYNAAADEMLLDKIFLKFIPMRGNDNLTGTTDLIEALDKGIAAVEGNSAVIWLITDNINDNSGSGDSSYANTLEFYKRLRSDANIQKILLYPIPERSYDGTDSTKGYVAYGIVYSKTRLSQAELEDYDSILRAGGIREKAITLKPLDIGTIVLKPKVTQSKITDGKIYFDGSSLRGKGFEEGEKVQETFNDLTLKSNLYPYIIKSAKLSVGLDNFTSSDYSVKSLGTQTISPSTVSNVSPEGEVTGFSIIFNLPEITPNFSFKTIFKEDFSIGGDLILEVSQVDILLDENYVNRFRELFALQSVPEIFQPVLKDKKIITKIPLELRMKYGPWRLFVLIGLIALVVLAILFLLYLLLKKKCFGLSIDNGPVQDVCLGGLSSYSVSTGMSGDLGKIKKSISGGLSFEYSKNTATPGAKTSLVENIPVEIQYEDEGFRVNSVTIMITGSDKGPAANLGDTDETGIY
ncbi:MAG: hypothetical protein JSS91_06785 [Bacteroidetes bacterium]|nr:hypothetical protein [Bacteroidota bacterium]